MFYDFYTVAPVARGQPPRGPGFASNPPPRGPPPMGPPPRGAPVAPRNGTFTYKDTFGGIIHEEEINTSNYFETYLLFFFSTHHYELAQRQGFNLSYVLYFLSH